MKLLSPKSPIFLEPDAALNPEFGQHYCVKASRYVDLANEDQAYSVIFQSLFHMNLWGFGENTFNSDDFRDSSLTSDACKFFLSQNIMFIEKPKFRPMALVGNAIHGVSTTVSEVVIFASIVNYVHEYINANSNEILDSVSIAVFLAELDAEIKKLGRRGYVRPDTVSISKTRNRFLLTMGYLSFDFSLDGGEAKFGPLALILVTNIVGWDIFNNPESIPSIEI